MKKRYAVLALAMMAGMMLGSMAGSAGAAEAKGKTIGIIMPTKEQSIWTVQGDRIKSAFEEDGYDTMIEYAEDDSAKQIMQIENMITKGVDVLIIAAVDCAALTEPCEKAKKEGILVIADDRNITNTEAVDYYVTCDYPKLAEMQGQWVADTLDLENAEGPFTMEIFTGSQDDTNSAIFYDGQMKILQPYIDSGKLVVKSGQTSLSETATQSWDTSKAQNRMDNLLSGFYSDSHLDVALCTSDCLSIGVISSLESMGYGTEDNPLPLITGQDAELAAVKNIVAGKQSMTVFIDANLMVEKMVPLVDKLLAGEEVEPDAYFNNEVFDVPTMTYEPLVIDSTNVDYLIDVGFYTEDEIYG